MLSIFLKEINAFFSSLIGYIAIGVFLVIMGLFFFVFPDTSMFNYPYATLEQLFNNGPLVFLFLIPAITMRLFAEENQNGTIELLVTKPVSDLSIIMGKFWAALVVVAFAILPTVVYYYTVYQLGSPKGNLDAGAIVGSYIGLFFLSATFISIGLFASALSKNQIVAFVLAAFLCFFLYYGFYFLSKLPVFTGKADLLIQNLGIDYHYESISRGVLDTRDIIYFLSVIAFFLGITMLTLESRKQ